MLYDITSWSQTFSELEAPSELTDSSMWLVCGHLLEELVTSTWHWVHFGISYCMKQLIYFQAYVIILQVLPLNWLTPVDLIIIKTSKYIKYFLKYAELGHSLSHQIISPLRV